MCGFPCLNVSLYLFVFVFLDTLTMDYKVLYPWAPENILEKISKYTSHKQIRAFMKSERQNKCHFGKENVRALRIILCREDESVVTSPRILRVPFAIFMPLCLNRFFFVYPYPKGTVFKIVPDDLSRRFA